AALLGAGRDLDPQARSSLGVIVDRSTGTDLEISLTQPTVPKEEKAALGVFIKEIVPDNIFNALSGGENLKVLFFAIIFGAAVGIGAREASNPLATTVETIYHACQRVIGWVNLTLPFALCALVASQIAKV